jgi:predicted metalloprotease with PDZ domain
MRIRPVEYKDVDYKTPPLSKGLWFSEGLTMYYADILMRRSHLPVFDSTRMKHVETLIRRYLSSSAYSKYSAEDVSLASYGPIGMLGDYTGSTHLQGEILGTMLDLIIRNATDGKHSMDDVMRNMMEKFSGENGFTSKDIETTIEEASCNCDLHRFFVDYVFGKAQINFNKYLALIGLQVTTVWKNALSADGKIAPDVRVYSWQPLNDSNIRLGISNPANCWTRAGLHTGDILKSVNGVVIKSSIDFRRILREIKFGDTVVVKVQRPKGSLETNVLIDGYQQPEVHLVEVTQSSAKQRRLFEQWGNAD